MVVRKKEKKIVKNVQVVICNVDEDLDIFCCLDFVVYICFFDYIIFKGKEM